MNIDLELYVELLQSEVRRLRADRKGASVAVPPIDIDTTKMSEETRQHMNEYIPNANRSFSRLSSIMEKQP